MALVIAPSTPKSQIVNDNVSTPSPGTWRHPKFDEIARRQNASTFTDSNVRQVIWNGAALLLLWVTRNSALAYPESLNTILPQELQYYIITSLNILSLISIFNIIMSLSPLIKKKDNFTDIALTPSQRALLGLDPKDTPPITPSTHFDTPPRYSRSSTPRNGSPGSRGSSNNNSPLSRNASPSQGLQGNDSINSPSAGFIWQKSVASSRESSRRHSYGSPSPLRPGLGWKDTSLLGTPSTPSPSVGRGFSVGLNNRWLYERGRTNSGNRGIYS